MEEIISKELLGNIFNQEVVEIYDELDSENFLGWLYECGDNPDEQYINIYELMHKAKSWASEDGDYVSSYIDFGSDIWFSQLKFLNEHGEIESKTFNDMTEYGAVFKMCQWKLENRGWYDRD